MTKFKTTIEVDIEDLFTDLSAYHQAEFLKKHVADHLCFSECFDIFPQDEIKEVIEDLYNIKID